MAKVTQCMMTSDTGTTLFPVASRDILRRLSLSLIHSLFHGHPRVSWDALLKVDHLRQCMASACVFCIHPVFLDKQSLCCSWHSMGSSVNRLVCGHIVVS